MREKEGTSQTGTICPNLVHLPQRLATKLISIGSVREVILRN